MFPEAPLALRLSGQLVLGVVRVYFRQLEFLDDDAAAAFTKLLKVRRTVLFSHVFLLMNNQ